MAGVHEMKTYKCVHDTSCIAMAGKNKNKIHKTHKTTVKQRSADDYKNYEKYFVDQLPYTDQELVDMSKLSLEDLRITAQSVSIEDAAARAGK